MEELQKKIVEIFKEEHQDWVQHIREAEEDNGEVDINLGGNFAARIEKLLGEFQMFRERVKKNRGRVIL